MGTVTKTFTENSGKGSKAKWTLSATANNITVSGSTFTYPAVTVKAKYVQATKTRACVYLHCSLDQDNIYSIGNYIDKYRGATHKGGGWSMYTALTTSGTTYTLSQNGSLGSAPTEGFWSSENPTERTLNFGFMTFDIYLSTQAGSSNTTIDDATHSEYSLNNQFTHWGNFCTATLDAPPTFDSTPTVTKDTNWWYNDLTTMTVSVPVSYDFSGTSATAKYGGYVKKIELDVGGQKVSKTYTSSTKPMSAQTLSMTLQNAGTLTPTVTITDSRDQSTTISLSAITVNQYTVPSVNFDVYRTNSAGVKADEGTYGLIKATITYTDAVATLTEPVVQINGTTTNNVTWYSSYSASTGVSNEITSWSSLTPTNHAVDVYGIINGSFSLNNSYQITITETDSQSGESQAITQTLSTAFYTIDFKAGGKEIAFGRPANDDVTNIHGKDVSDYGFFKCGMEAEFEKDVVVDGDVSADNITATGDISADNITATGDISADGITASGNISASGTLRASNETPTVTVTASTGTLISATAKRFGKVVQLLVTVQNSSSIAEGGNIFEGTLSTTALQPLMTTTTGSYYSTSAITATLATSGAIVIRNEGASKAFTSNVNVSFTYIIA